MTPDTRRNEIKRITSNLPEVYNRYFFTMGAGDAFNESKLASGTQQEQLSPTGHGKKKNAFSLNKTQKDSIRHVGEGSEMTMLANQTAKQSLRHYANKNVFQKTVDGGFKRKLAVDDSKEQQEFEDGAIADVKRKNFASLTSSHNGDEFEDGDEFQIQQNKKGSKVIHVKAEIDKVGRRTQAHV